MSIDRVINSITNAKPQPARELAKIIGQMITRLRTGVYPMSRSPDLPLSPSEIRDLGVLGLDAQLNQYEHSRYLLGGG